MLFRLVLVTCELHNFVPVYTWNYNWKSILHEDTYNCWIQAPEVEGVNPHFFELCGSGYRMVLVIKNHVSSSTAKFFTEGLNTTM